MTVNALLILLALFTIKHVVCDFLMQGPYQFLNKGKFLHPGGILHALINGVGTIAVIAIALPLVPVKIAVLLALLDFVTHYFIDFIRVNIDERYKWKPENSAEYWYVLGIDQALHSFVYLLIAWGLSTGVGIVPYAVLPVLILGCISGIVVNF